MLTTLQTFVPVLWALLGLWSFFNGEATLGIGFLILYHLERHTQRNP